MSLSCGFLVSSHVCVSGSLSLQYLYIYIYISLSLCVCVCVCVFAILDNCSRYSPDIRPFCLCVVFILSYRYLNSLSLIITWTIQRILNAETQCDPSYWGDSVHGVRKWMAQALGYNIYIAQVFSHILSLSLCVCVCVFVGVAWPIYQQSNR